MNILIFVIGLSAIVIEKPSIQGGFSHLEAIQNVPLFQTNAIQNYQEKKHDNSILIADAFEAFILIADFSRPSQEFFHYLKIYSLIRLKEYFLLI